ncbi:MAG: FAD-dependent oxidoreductase [Rhodovibrionaceae bacterium]
MRIAIVGSGISGLGAAWLLSRDHQVTLYEAAARPGGHSNTLEIDDDGRRLAVDTGFIVYNEPNYPNLTRLLAALEIETHASEMSFSVSLDEGRLEYAGSAAGLLAQPRNLLRPRMWRMTADMLRFFREAEADIPSLTESLALGDYLQRRGYSQGFAKDHLLPMGAAIWSCATEDMLRFPARAFLEFYRNHGLLNYNARPQWRSVVGGSWSYVERLLADSAIELRLSCPAIALHQQPGARCLVDARGESRNYDEVILACHGDQARAILGEAAAPETAALLAAFRYHKNRVYLHRDTALMPRRRGVWSSWNYLGQSGSASGSPASVTYWMNRLQNLQTETPVLVSLNTRKAPESEKTWATLSYDHPLFDTEALAAQRALPAIQGKQGIWFCGSYCGYGFHEDGLQAGFAVAEALGSPAPWSGTVTPISPAAWTARPDPQRDAFAVAAE